MIQSLSCKIDIKKKSFLQDHSKDSTHIELPIDALGSTDHIVKQAVTMNQDASCFQSLENDVKGWEWLDKEKIGPCNAE